LRNGDISLSLVHPRYVNSCWADAGRYLARAADRSNGRYTVESIKNEILSGRQYLWILFQGDNEMIAAMTTMFNIYPDRMNLCVAFIGSNDEMGWVKHTEFLLEHLENFAVENNCHGIECSGRDGWGKVLSPHGWEKTFTVFEKEIENG